MFFQTLQMCSQAIVAVIAVLVAVFVGFNNLARRESGVLHQLVACEQYVLELEGRLETVRESLSHRITSWLLPQKPHFVDESVASSTAGAFRRILNTFWPRLARFWQSTEDLQRCELVARNLDTQLDNVDSRLEFLRLLKSLITNHFGNVCAFSGVCLAVGGIVMMKNLKSGTKEEQNSGNEQQLLEYDFELDCSLEPNEEELLDDHRSLSDNEFNPEEPDDSQDAEDLLEEERALFQERKEQMEKEIGRLSHEINAIQKSREVETENTTKVIDGLKEENLQYQSEIDRLSKMTEAVQTEIGVIQRDREEETDNATKTIDGLKEENHHYQSEIARLSQIIEAIQIEKNEVTERSARTVVNLQQINEELKAESDLLSCDIEALQKQRQEEKEMANKNINDLQEKTEQLLKDIADKEASAEQHRIQTEEMELSIYFLRNELDSSKEESRARMQMEAQFFNTKEVLQTKIKQQDQVITDMTRENQRLEAELMDAKRNDFLRDEMYKALVAELEECKNKVNILENKSPTAAENSGASELELGKKNVRLSLEEVNKKEVQKADPKLIKPKMESDVFSRLGQSKPAPQSHQAKKAQKEDKKMIVTAKGRVKIKETEEEAGAGKDENHRGDQGYQQPPVTKKPQRQLITVDPMPDEPKLESNVFSRLGSPVSHQANKGLKEEKKMIITKKDRAKSRKLEENTEVDRKDDQKVEEECKKPQTARKAERKLIVFDL